MANDFIKLNSVYPFSRSKSDAVAGWVLYASFYYVLGQYNTTLKIIDHVLSRCTPDILSLYRHVSVYDNVGLHVH
jgi:hypothetical protein